MFAYLFFESHLNFIYCKNVSIYLLFIIAVSIHRVYSQFFRDISVA